MNVKKLSICAMLVSLALVLSYIETLLPTFTVVPGVKLGLANIAVIFALYKMGIKEAFSVSVLRVLAAGLLFGTILSLAYSLAGALVSFAVMVLFKKINVFTPVAVSVAGGVSHNMTQLLVACFILKTDILKYYIPVLILAGVLTGIAVGLISSALIKRVDIE